jgi:hypothetical protein
LHIGRYITGAVFAVALPAFSSSGGPRPDVSQYQSDHAQHGTDPAGGVIDQVRKATANFRDFKAMKDAEYTQFLGCVSSPQEGAMGVHFVNSKYIGDDELDINKPEALLYEPYNGAYRLVGVEYIVMVDAWQAHHKEPPVLAGQTLQYNSSPNRYGLPAFYELHVWAWRDNPHGTFVDWNPRVACGE